MTSTMRNNATPSQCHCKNLESCPGTGSSPNLTLCVTVFHSRQADNGECYLGHLEKIDVATWWHYVSALHLLYCVMLRQTTREMLLEGKSEQLEELNNYLRSCLEVRSMLGFRLFREESFLLRNTNYKNCGIAEQKRKLKTIEDPKIYDDAKLQQQTGCEIF
ncbi:hypothetical protein K0M31_002939 [Melipona bicolor]|uniref:Uncharacterized protein n=1 Tax=Melipona bicolor TaxID=60889 RepID=A0AA40G0I0_9HYME|nr:hypothetical protein K0M31_002939 [Melipona bicolor]